MFLNLPSTHAAKETNMSLNSIIEQVADAAGLETPVAEKTVGIMLSVLQQELDSQTIAEVFAAIPGAASMANANALSREPDGLAGFHALSRSGLTQTQVRSASAKLIAYVRANVGAATGQQASLKLGSYAAN